MKKVAIPVYNGKLSEFFGQCNHYQIYTIDNKRVKSEELEMPPKKDILKMPEWVSEKGITDIITYKINSQIIMLFNKYKINLFVGIDIDTPDKLITEFIEERIKSNNKIITEIIDKD